MSLQPINSPTTWKRAQTSINANFTALVNALAGPGTVDATDPVVTALLTDNGSGAYAAVEGVAEDVLDANADTLVSSRAITRAEAPVSIMEFDPAADGATDDSAALNAAADAARDGQNLATGSRGVYVPADVTLYINDVVDLRYVIDVRIEGRLRMGPNGLIIVGHSSDQRPGQHIRIREARWAGTQNNVCVRAVGMMQAYVNIGYCSSLELLADAATDATHDRAIAYNTFVLGRVIDLTLRGTDSSSWINENKFYGGDIKNTTITGDYDHQDNKFYGVSVEAGTIDVQTGYRNRWFDVRGEASTSVKFGAGTSRNIVEDGYSNHVGVRRPGCVLTEDLGVDNVLTSVPDEFLTSVELASLDRNTIAFDGACEYAGQGIVPGLQAITPRGNFQFVLDTGIFPLYAEPATWGSVTAYEQRWRLRRFNVVSDNDWFVPYITLYDSDGNILNTGIDTTGGWVFSTDHFQFNSVQRAAMMVITSTTATHARIQIRNSNTGKSFTYLRLTAFVQKPYLPAGVELIKRQLRRPLYQAAQPTEGVAHPGTVVQGPSGFWRSVARADTTTASSASSGAGSISVTSATGMQIGDVIGVVMTSGLTHWTTISGVSGTTISLTANLAGNVAAAAPVATTRWATVTD